MSEIQYEDYKYPASAPASELIEETTTAETPAGTRSFKFTTDGRTCSKSITFDIVDDNVCNVVYEGGCNGGCQGIARMSNGRSANVVAEILMPIMCTLNKKGSSCGMQLAIAIREAQKIING
jgi:hypothetical protein